MATRRLTVITENAIINSRHTLILNHQKFLLPVNFINEYPRKDVLKMSYRRFMRLKPFISQRLMVRNTYTEYLRYKYKRENYLEKRMATGIATGDLQSCDLKQVVNSLRFVLKAVTHHELSTTKKPGHHHENDICRRILKNILTMEYEKQRLIHKDPAIYYQLFRKTYEYLQPFKNGDKVNPIFLKLFSIREFDRCLVCLNETLDTRL
ncbi:LAFE_0D04984g1_1 [Lachancea fermentati]|uniref:LAFE_0D04984g1_1 n=1 Tax=Lachancea fermentati TaxID=4955 RepID=A0A1G4MBP2_LACFM|nr:LAFE_0D04984g1_1 [Lachancea fermentati]